MNPAPRFSTESAAQAYAYAQENRWGFVDLDNDVEISESTLRRIEAGKARDLNVLPVSITEQGRQINVAVSNPNDHALVDELRRHFTGMKVVPLYADPPALHRRIEASYSAALEAAQLSTLAATGASTTTSVAGGDLGVVNSTRESENQHRLRLIVEQATRRGATDIHLEATETGMWARGRVNTVLEEIGRYSRAAGDGLINLIKMTSDNMRPDNSRTPDSGVLNYTLNGRPLHLRVETIPSVWGTSAVLRMHSSGWRTLDTLDFTDHNLDRFTRAIEQPNGLVIACGPVNSGKTTTLHAGLLHRQTPGTKIVTVEDPVEHRVPEGITQIGINEEQGLTFAKVRRSLMRLDLNIASLAEIRDAETAEAATDLASTGRLVLTTIHANDSVGVIGRLTRLGVDRDLLADTFRCALSQRLVRRLCSECKVAATPNPTTVESLGFPTEGLPETVYLANEHGCDHCQRSGWSGLIAVHEVLLAGTDLAEAIQSGAPTAALRAIAERTGTRSLREDAYRKFIAGHTTLSEINTVVRRDLVA